MAANIEAANQSLFYCGHCNERLSKTQFYKHKKLFYDRKNKKWLKDSTYDDVDEEFEFSDDEDPSWFSDSAEEHDDENTDDYEGNIDLQGQ